MPCQPDRSLPLNKAVKPFGGWVSAAGAGHATANSARKAIADDRAFRMVILEVGVKKVCARRTSRQSPMVPRFPRHASNFRKNIVRLKQCLLQGSVCLPHQGLS